jgi:hypothetical protein
MNLFPDLPDPSLLAQALAWNALPKVPVGVTMFVYKFSFFYAKGLFDPDNTMTAQKLAQLDIDIDSDSMDSPITLCSVSCSYNLDLPPQTYKLSQPQASLILNCARGLVGYKIAGKTHEALPIIMLFRERSVGFIFNEHLQKFQTISDKGKKLSELVKNREISLALLAFLPSKSL